MRTRCPNCYRVNPLHAEINDPEAQPEPGDISLCFACAHIGIFTEDGVRKPTDEELIPLLADEHIAKARKALLESTDIHEAIEKAGSPEWVASDLIQELP